MSRPLRTTYVRERARGLLTDSTRPRFQCHDLTELVKQGFPAERRWITSDQVTPRFKEQTK